MERAKLLIRGVAQPGSALDWGSLAPVLESRHSSQESPSCRHFRRALYKWSVYRFRCLSIGWALLGIIQCLVVGCASKGEVAWQTAHAIDTLQTLEAVKSPCFREAHPITKRLIGERPSQGELIAWAVGAGMLHAWVSRRLEGRAQTLWQSITLTAKAGAVIHNHREGVRIGGTEC